MYIPHYLTQYWHNRQDCCSLITIESVICTPTDNSSVGDKFARAFEGPRLHRLIPTADGSALHWANSSGIHTGY